MSLSLEFMVFLRGLKVSEEQWISTCANFLKMSFNFLDFVTAFRVGDSISIEYGYQKHLPVWEILKQNKYVEVMYGQQ